MKPSSKTDWERLAKMDDKDIDTSDIPELDDAFFQNAELRVPVKKSVTLRPDADDLDSDQSDSPHKNSDREIP